MKKSIYNKIIAEYNLTEKEKELLDIVLVDNSNLDRLNFIVDIMIEYHLQFDVLISYLLYQYSKSEPELAEKKKNELTENEKKLYDTFKILQDVKSFSNSNQAEDIRRLFMAICQDMRVIIVKFATILYSLKQIKAPMTAEQHNFVKVVQEIFAPLAERLGLSMFKNEFEDLCFELLEPVAFNELKNDALMKHQDNMQQIATTKEKLIKILDELKIKGEIQSRQKHYYSVYKKLIKKNITLGKVYDLLAMRVLVPTIEDCYSVLGKIHAIYKPVPGRVKDYIANPKPNGYQSLHTTIVAENERPLEIQIRTFEMHKHSEYGVAAHWIYKEKRNQNKFDQKLTWFRQMIDNGNSLSNDEFLEQVKIDLFDASIIAQTPKGKILEFPQGSTIIDFAYAIHSQIGNTCVGGKINGKLVPITTQLSNGDVVEILTNPNSKGPSRDWLKHIRTSCARARIRTFFKTVLKDENIKIGKSILEQAIKQKNLNLTKAEKDRFLSTIASSLILDNVDALYAELGAGSLPVVSVIGRIVNLYNKEKSISNKPSSMTIHKNKEGISVCGDTGMLIRFAGCCSPVAGDEIIGYISRGRGVTIHRATCPNVNDLEAERLIDVDWEDSIVTNFTTKIKIEADDNNAVVNSINSFVRNLKDNLRGFGYKPVQDKLVFELMIRVSNRTELENIIKNIEQIKFVRKVYRDE